MLELFVAKRVLPGVAICAAATTAYQSRGHALLPVMINAKSNTECAPRYQKPFRRGFGTAPYIKAARQICPTLGPRKAPRGSAEIYCSNPDSIAEYMKTTEHSLLIVLVSNCPRF